MTGQIGLESTVEDYVAQLVAVFQAVRRVLRDDGTVWLNLGDSYNAAGRTGQGTRIGFKQGTNRASANGTDHVRATAGDLKPKDLIGIPWRVAFALQADGWYLRSDIIWHKPNPMPESVTDRPTKSHEYVFLLTKTARYYYDADAIREPHRYQIPEMLATNAQVRQQARIVKKQAFRTQENHRSAMLGDREKGRGNGQNTESMLSVRESGRNKRSVWTIATQPYAGSHFAVFPIALVEPCIKAGSSERGACPVCGAPWVRVVNRTATVQDNAKGSCFDRGKTGARDGGDRTQPGDRYKTVAVGWSASCQCDAGDPVPCVVLDLFAGAGTTLLVAERLGRDSIGIELNPVYAEMAARRVRDDSPMFTTVEVSR